MFEFVVSAGGVSKFQYCTGVPDRPAVVVLMWRVLAYMSTGGATSRGRWENGATMPAVVTPDWSSYAFLSSCLRKFVQLLR